MKTKTHLLNFCLNTNNHGWIYLKREESALLNTFSYTTISVEYLNFGNILVFFNDDFRNCDIILK